VEEDTIEPQEKSEMTARVLQGEGSSPKPFATLGKEKSPIWLFMITPVTGSRTCEPKT
jgi:hypothetical protein